MTRIELARRRAAGAKRAVVAVSAVAFAATLLLARTSHPGHATPSRASSATVTVTPTSGDEVPQVQTSVS
jgi:hypothetical protein